MLNPNGKSYHRLEVDIVILFPQALSPFLVSNPGTFFISFEFFHMCSLSASLLKQQFDRVSCLEILCLQVYGPEATMTGICKQAIDCIMSAA